MNHNVLNHPHHDRPFNDHPGGKRPLPRRGNRGGPILPVTLILLLSGSPALADVNSGSTSGCAQLAQGAASGAAAQIAADDQVIQAPQSVTQLSCLGNFFNGTGLNVITNFLNPGNLLQSVEGQICQAATSAFKAAIGSAECGITLNGFNIGGLGNLGFGNFCPTLRFGGNGAALGSVGVNGNGGTGNGLFINGTALTPSGYPAATGIIGP